MLRTVPLRRVSRRRLEQIRLYGVRGPRFLKAHPYCQVWLALRAVTEAAAIRGRGLVINPQTGRQVRVPRSTAIHHRNKRRGARLLDECEWLAVSWWGHAQVEENKRWARSRGFLRPF